MTKKIICKLLLVQFNSAFSIPLSNKMVTDLVSLFAVFNACYKKSEVLVTTSTLVNKLLLMLFLKFLLVQLEVLMEFRHLSGKKICY